MDLQNKVAIITGGGQGFGKAFGEELLSRGANIVVVDISPQTGQQTANSFNSQYGPGRAMFMKCDVSKDAELVDIFEKTKSQYGHIDLVVNNAGIGHETMLQKMVDINVKAVIQGSLLAVQYMSKDKGGRGGLIVNLGSTSGLTSVPFGPKYSGTKAAVIGFTRSLAARDFETTEQGIRVTCLCPSFTNTKMVQSASERLSHDKSAQKSRDKLVASTGIMEIGRVVEAFMRLVDNPQNNGGVMVVTPKQMAYRYPSLLKGKL